MARSRDLSFLFDENCSENVAIDALVGLLTPVLETNLVGGMDYANGLLASECDGDFAMFIREMMVPVDDEGWCCEILDESKSVAVCRDCAVDDSTMVCLTCFAKGNHNGHTVRIRQGKSGRCACGHAFAWKSSGTCADHGRMERPELCLDRAVRIKVVAITTALLNNLCLYCLHDVASYDSVMKWINQMADLRPAVLRCIALSIKNAVSITELLDAVIASANDRIECMLELMRALNNDAVFVEFFCMSIVANFAMFTRTHLRLANMRESQTIDLALFKSGKIVDFMKLTLDRMLVSEMMLDLGWVDTVIESLAHIEKHALNLIVAGGDIKRMTGKLIYIISTIVRNGIAIGDDATNERFLTGFCRFLERIEGKWLHAKGSGNTYDREVMMKSVHVVMVGIMELVEVVKKGMLSTSLIPLHILVEYQRKNDYDTVASVFEENGMFGPTYGLGMIAFGFTMRHDRAFSDICREIVPNYEELCIKWLVLPLRHLFAIQLSHWNFFKPDGDMTLATLGAFRIDPALRRYRMRVFHMVQKILMSVDNVENVFKLVVAASGVLCDDKHVTYTERPMIIRNFLLFTGWLIFDRTVMNGEAVDIEPDNDVNLGDEPRLLSILDELGCNRNVNEHEYCDQCHPFVPFTPMNWILRRLVSTVALDECTVPVPILPPELKHILVVPEMLAIYFDALSSDIDNVCLQLIFQMLITASREFPEEEQPSGDVITVSGMHNLIRALSGFAIRRFVHQKIVYNGRPEASIISILAAMHYLGRRVIHGMGLELDVPVMTSEDMARSKERAASKKQDILDWHTKRARKIRPYSENESNCTVCDGTGSLYYPVMVFRSVILDVMYHRSHGTKPNGAYRVTPLVKLWLDRRHTTCRDGCQTPQRSGFLPKLEGLCIGDELKSAMCAFLSLVSGDDDNDDVQIDKIIPSYCAQIELLELGHRSNPLALDDTSLFAMLRNFYLCLRYFVADETAPSPENEDPFVYIVHSALKRADDFSEYVARVAASLTPLDMYALLRKCAIFEWFGLGKNYNAREIPDWDALMSYDALTTRYVLPAPSMHCQLPFFRFLGLPEVFQRFDNSGPFVGDGSGLAVCLITGRFVQIPKVTGEFRHIHDEIDAFLGGGVSVFLPLTGPPAGSLILVSGSYTGYIPSVYVKKYGVLTPANHTIISAADALVTGEYLRMLRHSD